jgi:hypothetical protein
LLYLGFKVYFEVFFILYFYQLVDYMTFLTIAAHRLNCYSMLVVKLLNCLIIPMSLLIDRHALNNLHLNRITLQMRHCFWVITCLNVVLFSNIKFDLNSIMLL